MIFESNNVAEVILIETSLGSLYNRFFKSIRTKNFLDCKGVPYYTIDANQDVAQGAGYTKCVNKNLRANDFELLQLWVEEGLVLLVDNAERKFCLNALSELVVVPQVLIDGIRLNSENVLQDLEEENKLDDVFCRVKCPSCIKPRDAEDCKHCGAVFRNLIPSSLVASQKVLRYCCGELFYE